MHVEVLKSIHVKEVQKVYEHYKVIAKIQNMILKKKWERSKLDWGRSYRDSRYLIRKYNIISDVLQYCSHRLVFSRNSEKLLQDEGMLK